MLSTYLPALCAVAASAVSATQIIQPHVEEFDCELDTKEECLQKYGTEWQQANRDNRIVNGNAVTVNQEAAFYTRLLTCAGGCSICGSSWISGTFILTAAHCVDSANAEVNFYENAQFNNQFPSNFAGASGQVTGNDIIVHTNWNPDNVGAGWDIALLNTRRSTPYPAPIKLADMNFF